MSYTVTLNHVASNSAHWALWDIPATVTSLDEDVMHALMPAMPAGAKQTMHNGFDGFTGAGYLGPCPQANNSRQMYRYTVHALGVRNLTTATTGSTTAAAQTAITNARLPGAGSSASLVGDAVNVQRRRGAPDSTVAAMASSSSYPSSSPVLAENRT
jgi:hypothetical protein